jgi:hypothetical protein
MKRSVIILIAFALCMGATLARADWDQGDPYKWVQLPDPNGWDVNATAVEILADDFLCSETGWITDIHFWGSWKNGGVGTIDSIYLNIHEDVPAGQDPERAYSHPGDVLWSRVLDPQTYGGVVIREWGTGQQGWYDPATGEYSPDDHFETWQVNVFLNPEDWFLQEGTAAEPTVYWLSITAVLPAGGPQFGWKTSESHWNDDAVSGIWFGPAHGQPQWGQDLHDPITGETLDLAFVITGVPIPEPGMYALIGTGLLGLLAWRRRK